MQVIGIILRINQNPDLNYTHRYSKKMLIDIQYFPFPLFPPIL